MVCKPLKSEFVVSDVQLTKIENKSSAKEICHEIHDKLFDPDSYLFSSFTLLYFVSKVLTQMMRAVSYTHGCMYKLMLYILSLFLLLFFVYPEFF